MHDDDAGVSRCSSSSCMFDAHARLPLRWCAWYIEARQFSADAQRTAEATRRAFAVLFGCRARRLLFEPIDRMRPPPTRGRATTTPQLEQRAGASAPSELEAAVMRARAADWTYARRRRWRRSPRRRRQQAHPRRRLDAITLRRPARPGTHAPLNLLSAPATPIAHVQATSPTRNLLRAVKRWTNEPPSALLRQHKGLKQQPWWNNGALSTRPVTRPTRGIRRHVLQQASDAIITIGTQPAQRGVFNRAAEQSYSLR